MLGQLYIQKASMVHSFDFWIKILCFLVILPLTAFIAKPLALLFLIIFLISLVVLSKIGLEKFWQQVKSYLIFIGVGLMILSLIFVAGSISERILAGIELYLRFALLISFGIFFSLVTNPIEFPAGFLRARIPHKYGITLMVGYRMMPLLSQKVTAIIEAQKARGASFKFSLIRVDKFILQIMSLAIPLLHATLEMSVRLSDTLISRGYDPNGKITILPRKQKVGDFLVFLTSSALLIIGVLA